MAMKEGDNFWNFPTPRLWGDTQYEDKAFFAFKMRLQNEFGMAGSSPWWQEEVMISIRFKLEKMGLLNAQISTRPYGPKEVLEKNDRIHRDYELSIYRMKAAWLVNEGWVIVESQEQCGVKGGVWKKPPSTDWIGFEAAVEEELQQKDETATAPANDESHQTTKNL